jgi:DHA1 family tetracycline resistance protein-like MFS transporter
VAGQETTVSLAPLPSDGPTTVLSGGRRKAAIGFIFATALMDVIALGIMIPVLPNLVKELVGGDTATATEWTGLFSTAWALMQFVFAPLVGLLSDRFGRRPVLLLSIAGLGIDFLFMALAPSLAWLFVGRVINGITAASFSTASAYVSDITPPERRAQAFGLMGAAFGVGFVVGPAIGGYLGSFSLRLPFYVAAAMALLNWLYGFFVLPESLPPERRAPTFDWKRANPAGALRLLLSHPGLLGFGAIVFLYQLAHNVLPSIFVLYMGFRYGWSPGMVGLSMMATGAMNVVLQGGLVGRVVKRFGERTTLLFGLAAGAAGFTLYGFAATPLLYWLALPVFACAAFVTPGLMGLMTRRVASWEQGQLQGANASIMGLTGLIGPGLFTGTFAWAVRNDATVHMPGLPIFFAAALMALAFVCAWVVAHPVPEGQPESVRA